MCNLEHEDSGKRPHKNDIAKMIKTNAYKYKRYKDQLPNIPIEEINEFRLEVEQAFNRIQRNEAFLGVCESGANNGIHSHNFIIFVDYDPYPNLEALTRHIQEQNKMYVSSLHNDSKLLPGYLNLKFRAVHDFLHYFLQQPFNFEGEYKVYQAQKHIHKSRLRRQILYSEVVLQAAYCEFFGKFADNQKIVL